MERKTEDGNSLYQMENLQNSVKKKKKVGGGDQSERVTEKEKCVTARARAHVRACVRACVCTFPSPVGISRISGRCFETLMDIGH